MKKGGKRTDGTKEYGERSDGEDINENKLIAENIKEIEREK